MKSALNTRTNSIRQIPPPLQVNKAFTARIFPKFALFPAIFAALTLIFAACSSPAGSTLPAHTHEYTVSTGVTDWATVTPATLAADGVEKEVKKMECSSGDGATIWVDVDPLNTRPIARGTGVKFNTDIGNDFKIDFSETAVPGIDKYVIDDTALGAGTTYTYDSPEGDVTYSDTYGVCQAHYVLKNIRYKIADQADILSDFFQEYSESLDWGTEPFAIGDFTNGVGMADKMDAVSTKAKANGSADISDNSHLATSGAIYSELRSIWNRIFDNTNTDEGKTKLTCEHILDYVYKEAVAHLSKNNPSDYTTTDAEIQGQYGVFYTKCTVGSWKDDINQPIMALLPAPGSIDPTPAGIAELRDAAKDVLVDVLSEKLFLKDNNKKFMEAFIVLYGESLTEFDRAIDCLVEDANSGYTWTRDNWKQYSDPYEKANGLTPVASLSPQEAGQPRLAALDTEEFGFDASKALVDATVEDKKALPVVDKKDEKLA